jgi:hypothetical protein
VVDAALLPDGPVWAQPPRDYLVVGCCHRPRAVLWFGGEAAAQCQALVVRTVTLDQTAMRLELRLGGKEPARCPGLALPFAPVSVAEDARFELARRCHQHAFQACALGH